MRFLMLTSLFWMTSVCADYDSNFKGKVLDILTYTSSPLILVRLENQPSTHPLCSQFDYLAIAPETAPEVRQIVFSRLLSAYATGEVVNIGYDGKDECVSTRIKVYRVG